MPAIRHRTLSAEVRLRASRKARVILCAVVAGLAGKALSASAPPAPGAAPTTVEGVVVSGKTPAPEKLYDIVHRFVVGHSVPGRTDHVSRWATAACPEAFGLTSEMNAFVAARVKEVAANVGVPGPRPGAPCETNVLIVFTTVPQTIMDDVRDHHSRMLGFHYFAQAKRLAMVTRPIQSWYMTGTGGKHVEPELDDEFLPMPGGAAGSRLSDGLTSKFVAVLVIVDSTKVVGQEIGAIADNIAMLSLAHGPAGKSCSELPTILDLLNPACSPDAAPAGLTRFDLAYLKALYSIEPAEFLTAQRSEIGTRIMRELADTPKH